LFAELSSEYPRYKMEMWWVLDFFYPVFPHVVCITEHHSNHYEMTQFQIDNCTVGANYCRHSLKKGGACVFVHNRLSFVGINLR